MKVDLSKIDVIVIVDDNGDMIHRLTPSSFMTQGDVLRIKTKNSK